MALALMAYLHLMSTDADDLPTARATWQTLSQLDANERERAHAAAIGAWLDGDWHGAAAQLDELLCTWPTDLLALMIGHQLDFFLGDAQNLRDRPTRTLRELDPDDPHSEFVRGMAAFGLEEAGHYGQALDAGLAAVEANPDDVWGIHAVVHTYEMQGRVDEGIRFLGGDGTRWESGNLFTVHNWWHLALYQLEAGRPERSLDIYDAEIHHSESAGVPIEMLDGSALLWRLMLDGVDTGDRFEALANAWVPKISGVPWYAFNDLHGVMALAGAGRHEDIRTFVTDRERWLDTATGSNARMTADIGLPASRAILAFVEERYDDVIEELWPIRRTLAGFGGSHAQRDALHRTLLEAALRSGRYELPAPSPPSASACATPACTAGANVPVHCEVSAMQPVRRMPSNEQPPTANSSPTRTTRPDVLFEDEQQRSRINTIERTADGASPQLRGVQGHRPR